MDALQSILPVLSRGEWMVHGLIFAANIILFFLARPILNLIEPTAKNSSKVKIFQALNVLVFVLHAIDLVLLGSNAQYQQYFIKLGYSLMLIYGTLLLYSLLCALSKRRFGKVKELDDKKFYIESYSSRLVELVLLVIIVLSVIYALVVIWEAQNMFTGIYAASAAFLAFTSSIWAPDIISGLIILNTEILEDGDVVVIDGHKNEYVISRVTLIYVVLYDIRNNNRTLMRNSQFTQNRIDNLSRVASTNGIRQGIVYKIGYPQFSGHRDDRLTQLAEFRKTIDGMFDDAYAACCENENIKVNSNKSFEWAMTNAGDYALEYTLWIYLERIPNSKVTSTLRRHLMGTIYKINEAVYIASIAHNVDLSTPDVHQVTMNTTEPIIAAAPVSTTPDQSPLNRA